MFLKNVPPVVALHTEWRSYGPTRSFSLPLCFNDTDSDISTPGTPIPEKVQMIIDGLRSTQSSLDMSSEYEGNLQAGPAPAPGYTSKAGDATHKARHRSTMAGVRADDQRADPVGAGSRSPDSDSDDSVDRGIEEAIQEYLKEKGDHKRKLEPATSPSQVPKQAKRGLFLSDSPKHSDSNKILTASSNHIPKSAKASYSVAIDKKRFKNDRSSEGNLIPCKKGDLNKAVKNFSFESQKHPFDLTTYPYKVQPLGALKVVEESPDSSSDDGIEEAIQHYQLEKKKDNPEDPRKSSKPLRLNEESDSSSDDGIEEAIRRYQLEKQIEKSRNVTKVSKPSQPKQTQVSKATAPSLDHSGTRAIKKQKVLTKKKKKERSPRPALSVPVASCDSLSRPVDSHEVKDNCVNLTKNTTLLEVQSPAPLKVNTTAELMCAEAILDISKAVMPEAFAHSTALTNNCVQSTFLDRDGSNCLDNKSDESSVDSDDGIEQEIRKFLELKAQMHNQPSGPPSFACAKEQVTPAQQKRKLDPSRNKKLKHSLSDRRKHKEENGSVSKGQGSKEGEEPHPNPLTLSDRHNIFRTQASATSAETAVPLHVVTTPKREGPMKNGEQKHSPISLKDTRDPGTNEGVSRSSSLKNEVSKSSMLAERRAQTGDKSSSLDSDEDLDAAIKDLLLTKKKVKKKMRDRKVRSRKSIHFGVVELCCLDEAESEKKAAPSEHKTLPNPNAPKSYISKSSRVKSKQNTNGRSVKSKMSKGTSERPKAEKKVKPSSQVEQTGEVRMPSDVDTQSCGGNLGAGRIEEDSGSVDSDDSIEQEIRRFLAEKAKLSTERTNDSEERKDSTVKTTVLMADGGVKLEAQQAEVPPTAGAQYTGLPDSGVSGQPGCREGEILQSIAQGLQVHLPQSADKRSPPAIVITSNSSSHLQADRQGDAGNALKRSQGIWEESNIENSSQGKAEASSVHKAGVVTPSTNTEPIRVHQVNFPAETGVSPLSQSPLYVSPPSPKRVREVRVASTSHRHDIPCSHQTRSFIPAGEVRCAVCPAAGGCENTGQDGFIEPSHHSTETPISVVSPVHTSAPARLPCGYFMHGRPREGNPGQNPTPSLLESTAHKDVVQAKPDERSNLEGNHVQRRSRDLGRADDRKVCPREREDRKRAEGELKGEGEEECVDETDYGSEERPSGSQRSKERRQSPRL
ncbi:protein phosphatase 1 regulatory subunit 26 [Megalops cyprinoides]|uniref:protein phosphatase 1 regulatory subunit 26 n=1 Tax=Megalops cyprinoides TaxID=118141 RepID=UPI0018640574|nr:protein phosphatase 1 regulatory subunit 26 [Megalops cyprinoides]